MQIHKGFKHFRAIEEFSGPMTSVSAHQDGRVFLHGECLHSATKWMVSFSAAEGSKLLSALAAEMTNVNHEPVADSVTHTPLLSDASNPHFVENHR